MNIGVYDQVMGALVPRNEGVPLADYDLVAVWTLHPIQLAYMAKFGVPCFPETKASLCQIVIF